MDRGPAGRLRSDARTASGCRPEGRPTAIRRGSSRAGIRPGTGVQWTMGAPRGLQVALQPDRPGHRRASIEAAAGSGWAAHRVDRPPPCSDAAPRHVDRGPAGGLRSDARTASGCRPEGRPTALRRRCRGGYSARGCPTNHGCPTRPAGRASARQARTSPRVDRGRGRLRLGSAPRGPAPAVLRCGAAPRGPRPCRGFRSDARTASGCRPEGRPTAIRRGSSRAGIRRKRRVQR
jgi:hypothetical protein